MEDDNPKEIFWVLSVIGVVEKRRTRECTIYKHGPSRWGCICVLSDYVNI